MLNNFSTSIPNTLKIYQLFDKYKFQISNIHKSWSIWESDTYIMISIFMYNVNRNICIEFKYEKYEKISNQLNFK